MLVVGGKASPRATHTSMPRRGEAAGAATPPSSDEDEEELSSSVSGGGGEGGAAPGGCCSVRAAVGASPSSEWSQVARDGGQGDGIGGP